MESQSARGGTKGYLRRSLASNWEALRYQRVSNILPVTELLSHVFHGILASYA
jgi:hypothetical protein